MQAISDNMEKHMDYVRKLDSNMVMMWDEINSLRKFREKAESG